jgi:DNA-binding transcriptional LysR family regulator
MLRELKTFLAVARHGTFASAGAHIGLTQSAVSAQMQRLEEELGFALFDRTGRSARLNEQGEETLEKAEEILKLCSGLGSVAQAPETGGKLSIGAIESAQAGPLVEALARFHAEFPGFRTRVVPGVSLNLLGMVDSAEVDLAVMIRPPFALPAELDWRVLARQPFVLLVPNTVKGSDWRRHLAEQPFVRYDRASFGGRLVDQFLQRLRIDVHDVVEIDDQEGLVRLVACGVGVALVPASAAARARWPRGARAVELGDQTFHREIGLAQRRDRSRRLPARQLAQCIGEAFAAP